MALSPDGFAVLMIGCGLIVLVLLRGKGGVK